MKPSLLTSQTIAVFGSINDLRMPLEMGREESHFGSLSDILALGPRLREDDG